MYLLKQEFYTALRYFIESLKGAIKLKFPRLIADSLYGIYRALKQIEDEKDEYKHPIADAIEREEFLSQKHSNSL